MKKIAKLTLFLMFMFILPIFSFGCGEVLFDDVPYLASSSTTQDVITKVDNSRYLMINSIELKVKLSTVNTYNYLQSSTQQAKVIRDEIVTTLGKTSDNPAIAQIEKTRYVNNIKTYYELKSYSHKTLQGGQENSYVYTFVQSYDDEGNITSSSFNRSSYNQTMKNFLSMYNDAVPTVNANYVNAVSEKEFEGTKYYKLSSDVVGLENLKNNFSIDNTLYSDAKLFTKNSLLDYVKPFECVFGLKTLSAYDYITYFTLNYQIENEFREVYLDVSSVTNMVQYGDTVVASVPENVDEYTVHTFVDVMNQTNYLTYNTSTENTYSQVTVAEFGKNYSIVVKDYAPGIPMQKTNYFYQYDNQNNTYKCYKLDLDNQTKEEAIYDLAYLKFDFTKEYAGKSENYYQFGVAGSYINIQVADGEVYKVNIKESNSEINMFVVEYGTDINKLGLVSNIDSFNFVEAE